MNRHWEESCAYMERKYTDPDFYQDAPGIPLAELIQELKKLEERDRNLPRVMSKAHAVAFTLENMQIAVSDLDYFPALASCQKRPTTRSHMSDWGFKYVAQIFSAAEQQIIADCRDPRVVQLRTDFDHSVPDWDAVLELGFSGLLERVCRFEESKRSEFPAHPEYQAFYESIKIEYRAALVLLDRLIAEAEKLPPHRKGGELLRALRQLRSGKAETFYEALLQIWLFFQLSEYVDCIQTRSFGNLDRILYPYFQRDIAGGRFTEADIREIIRHFLYQITAMHYTVGHPFYFGGTNADGSSAINRLSAILLEEYADLGIFDPKLQIKVSADTPPDFLDFALNLIRSGRNSIAFVGEPCIVRTMLKHGYSLREAQTADIKGCYEYCARGSTVETAPLTINTAKILGLTLRNGVELLSGKPLGLVTGKAESFTTFKQFYRAYLKQLFFQIDRFIPLVLRLEKDMDMINPAPFFSGTVENSLRTAQDGYARGCRYNNTNIWLCGMATTADSLTAIKRYVFDKKELTLPELVEILDRDFEGNELLRQRLLHDPEKYGNDMELPDLLATHVAHAAARRYNGKPNSRGGFFTMSLHASNRFIQWADQVEATPDGRKRGDELSKNMSATQGNALKGATAIINSVLKFDSSCFMADLPVDIMLHPSEVKGEAGLAAMRALVMSFIKNYGHAIHFNVMDCDTLRKAQNEPEKYRHLQVRICGWNVLWNSIPKAEQDAYIRQAEVL